MGESVLGDEIESLNVLLIDDQLFIWKALTIELSEERDIKLHFAQTPDGVEERIRTLAPSVILQDLNMPTIDGLTLMKRYRECEEIADIPVILLSAQESPHIKYDAFAAGVNDYVVKFPNKVELIARIRRHARAFSIMKERDALRVREREILDELSRRDRFEALGRIASAVAHELNTPLQYINDNLRFIKRSIDELRQGSPMGEEGVTSSASDELGELEREVVEAIRDCEQGAHHIERIASSMGYFSRAPQSNAGTFALEPVLRDVLVKLEREGSLGNYSCDVAFKVEEMNGASGDHKSILLTGPPHDLAQAIENILRNSIAATVPDDGSIPSAVTQSNPSISLTARVTSTSITITITDTGHGIPSDIQHRVWDPFFTTRPLGKGIGQGLPIAKALIEGAFNGTVTLESTEGLGISVELTLPRGR